jgi:hypothetical protein
VDDLNLLSGATAMPGRGDMPAGHVSTGPPNVNGGNVDIKHITKGTTLFLPVFVEGAYFSVGTLVLATKLASYSLRKSFDRGFFCAAGFEFETSPVLTKTGLGQQQLRNGLRVNVCV